MVPLKQYRRRRRPPTEIKDLTPDILFEIFARVPMKYLLQLTTVCKSYKALIRSHEFRRFHHEKNTMKIAPDYLLVRNRIGGQQRGFSIYSARTFAYDENSGLPRSIDIPMQMQLHDLPLYEYGFTVYGSCNGLLCISLFSLDLDSPLYLYNPSLRKFKQLPRSEFELPQGTSITSQMATSLVTLGFGFHSGMDDYQVVRFVHPNTSIFYAEVYSLKLNSWTPVENVVDPREVHAWFMEGCTCLDGVIYWHLMQRPNMSLVSFNMHTSVLGKRTLPYQLQPVMRPICLQVLHPECLRALHENSVQVSKKSLCLFQVIQRGCHHYCDIWVLKEDTEEKIGRIRLPPHASIAWPLGFSTNGNVAYMVITEDQDLPLLVQYVPLLNRIQTVITQISHRPWYVDAYRESLVLLDEI
ncbi:putative F-box domain-containing protein [Rosa chinensis]|uniref:Putative F-box domain-containing protein n=1 Tax=Rosa chinensis TaxID=74649 RepID=A0A2P6RFR9_ROSCH|nr:F-box protein CPR1 [Rosa chinensis]PRQ45288.1 putative F-box domain-containing protein [Rosa chinensis]